MFIYFPEYAYKKIKNYYLHTINSGLNNEELKNIFIEKLKDPEYSNMISNFKNKNISLPTIKFKNCNSLFKNEILVNLGIVSNYNRIDNKIEICNDFIINKEHCEYIISKELTYAIEFNNRKGKLGLNDYAEMSISACKNSLNKNSIHKLIQSELIKRCAYIELKYKFTREIKNYYDEEFPEMENIKLNEIVRKIIDLNKK